MEQKIKITVCKKCYKYLKKFGFIFIGGIKYSINDVEVEIVEDDKCFFN